MKIARSGLLYFLFFLGCTTASRAPSSKIEEHFDLSSEIEFPKQSRTLSQWKKLPITQMSDDEISQTFQILAATNLPFLYPKDCCHDRAHKMSYWMDQQGIQSLKIFVFGDLKLTQKNGPDVDWEFHVAPALLNQSSQLIILDPSVADRPLEISQWLLKFSKPRQKLRVVPATRFYFTPYDLEFERTEWNLSEMKELVDLSLMGCKAIENRKKSQGQ